MKKTGRNEPCYCGSGKKYKKCCLKKDEEEKYSKTLNESHENIEDNELSKDKSYDNSPDAAENEASNIYLEENEDSEPEGNRVKYISKEFVENIPELSIEKEKLINKWWDEYKVICKETNDDPAKIKNHIEIFLNNYPELALNQYLHDEVIFELEARYLKKGNYDEFITFLKWYRNKFPEAYMLNGTYYDHYLISYSLVKGEMDQIPLFFPYYHEYPDHDVDNLMKVIDLLVACNCEELIIKLLKDIYPYIFYSSNVIGADEFVIPILISKYTPYLKPDFTEEDIEALVNNLKELDSQIPEMEIITEKENWEKILKYMFINTPDFGYYKEQGKLKDYYEHIFWNFKAYLHNYKNKCWITAHYYSKSVCDYLLRKMKIGKKQKSNFTFDEKSMEKYILEYYRGFFEIKPVVALMFLQAVYFFAEYLQKLNTITIQEKKDIENNCIHLYDIIYKAYLNREYSVRIFEKLSFTPA